MLRSIATDTRLQTTWLDGIARKINWLAGHRYTPWVLLIAGLLRNITLILAYPPAHGADSIAYFLYAEHLGGLRMDSLTNVAYPLYSIFVLAAFNWLGSIYWLIALQFVMSACIASLYYLALKRYSPALALLCALLILGDTQLGLLFNFTSTEPLYVFLMALTLYLLLRQADLKPPPHPKTSFALDAAIGVLALLLLLTRSVGRYLILPFALIFGLRTRSWRRALALLAGFGASLLIYLGLSRALIGEVNGLDTGNYLIGVIMFEHPEWVSTANGPASAEWVDILERCPKYFQFLDCLEEQKGSWDAGVSLMSATARETVLADPWRYAQTTWQKLLDFLSLSGQIYGVDPGTPAQAQCENFEERLANMSDRHLLTAERGSTLTDQSPQTLAQFRERVVAIRSAMCPPLPHSPQLQSIVDFVSYRYRSLGRPNPHLWYGALFLLVLVVPWARRYFIPLLVTGVVLLNHALPSALISNIQPRYVVVTNPMRAILLCMLIFIVVKLVIYTLDWLLTRRRAQPLTS